jgi:glycine/D-amino acid oxidase-like deaminating enzyme/nitrite reductase/ring-hydroxylating ferredoxin subunit
MPTASKSIWIDESPIDKTHNSLKNTVKADVCIVGGGITGVTAAYLLTKAGKKVVLLERDMIGGGETAYTTAFITYIFDEYLHDIVRHVGEGTARIVWESGKRAIDLIEEIVTKEKIDCEFKRVPAYVYTNTKKDKEKYLDKEVEIGKRLGFDISLFESKELGFKNTGGMKICCQAKFQPLQYIQSLMKIAETNGAEVYEQTEVRDWENKGERVEVRTDKGTVEASYVLFATHAPINSAMNVQLKLTPYQTYVIEGELPKNTLAEALYWDTEEPYHYLRIDKCNTYDRFILGGEDHKTGQEGKTTPQQRWDNLEKYLQTILPDIKYEIKHRWSGQIYESVDGIPYIGSNPLHKNELLGTGFAGNGMTFGTITAKLCSDIVLKRSSDWLSVYNPSRISGAKNAVAAGVDYIKEMTMGRLFKRATVSEEDVEVDEGAVIEIDGKKVALYKDKDGTEPKLSAVCTHAGCIVDWNSAEKTWDCPCHGSRFSKNGEVLRGPARKSLERIM